MAYNEKVMTMRASQIWGFVVCVVASAAGCAAPAVGEERVSSNAAITTGGEIRSFLNTGLYADDNFNYLRVRPSGDTLREQRVEWIFDGEQGAGVSDVVILSLSGRIDVQNENGSSITINKSGTKGAISVLVDGAKAPLTLTPVSYSSLNTTNEPFHPSGPAADDFIISTANATEAGIDVTVSGNGNGIEPSTQHFTWANDAFVGNSSECGNNFYFARNVLISDYGDLGTDPLTGKCAAFFELIRASGKLSVAFSK